MLQTRNERRNDRQRTARAYKKLCRQQGRVTVLDHERKPRLTKKECKAGGIQYVRRSKRN